MMDRRKFLRITGAGTAAGMLGTNLWDIKDPGIWPELGYHRIADIKYSTVKLKYPRQVGKNARLDIHGWGPESGIHILYTDKGAMGWGMNRSPQKDLNERFNLIKGRNISELVIPELGITSPELEGFDFSLYDLAGKILDKPVYRLLGKRRPETHFCYSGMIYFDDLEPADNPAGTDKLLEECLYDYNYGYRQFKLKIGRGNKWMEKEKGLKRDIEITRLISQSFPDCDILVDGNNGFTLEEFLQYLEGIRGIKLFWIEEPFHETIENYVKLDSWLKVHGLDPLLADGEANPDEEVLKQLSSQKIIKVLLQDISGMGFTKWIKYIQNLRAQGLLASPHAWGSAIKTNYISHLGGAFGSMATIEGVTCTSDDVNLTDYRLKRGKLVPSSKPGFGMDLLKKI